MFKKLLRMLFTLLGAFIGYGCFMAVDYWILDNSLGQDVFSSSWQKPVAGIIIALIFALVFFRLTPLINRQSKKLSENIEHDLQGVSANEILIGTIGLILGLLIALLVTQIYATLIRGYVYAVLSILTYVIMGYLGVVVSTKKGKEFFTYVVQARKTSSSGSENNLIQSRGSKKKQEGIPKIFDTSVIIDGRIAEIMKTGFIEGPIIIPEFVLVELRHIADSSDSLKRTRGRRGLDILNKIQEDYGVEIYNTENEKTLKEIPEVDVKLLKLAQIMKGYVVTNDFNLNKVATINGVKVLNINELANTLKPVVLPGEEMTVSLVKQGKDSAQAIGYLDDGTMIVVENGRRKIGQTTEINVTSVLQTSAGRMIFGRLK